MCTRVRFMAVFSNGILNSIFNLRHILTMMDTPVIIIYDSFCNFFLQNVKKALLQNQLDMYINGECVGVC